MAAGGKISGISIGAEKIVTAGAYGSPTIMCDEVLMEQKQRAAKQQARAGSNAS